MKYIKTYEGAFYSKQLLQSLPWISIEKRIAKNICNFVNKHITDKDFIMTYEEGHDKDCLSSVIIFTPKILYGEFLYIKKYRNSYLFIFPKFTNTLSLSNTVEIKSLQNYIKFELDSFAYDQFDSIKYSQFSILSKNMKKIDLETFKDFDLYRDTENFNL